MRLSDWTAALVASGRKALVAFFTAGYPDDDTFLEAVAAAAEAGCDVVEIGVPFSDPIADGPVIQSSSAATLARGMTLRRALALAGELTGRVATPLLIMSYVNPILAYGVDAFARDAGNAGVLGAVLPDVPLEESSALRRTLNGAGIDTVDLVAPTSSDERITAIAIGASGFLYLVSMTGVTGSRTLPAQSLPAFVDRVRSHTATPLYVGFGVSTPGDAAALARCADGVIIGSQLIRTIDDGGPERAAGRVGSFIADVRAAIDAEGD